MTKARILSVALLAALGCRPADAPSASDTPPNIVLIISDDHFWGDHGFMGNAAVQTPNLDDLAARG